LSCHEGKLILRGAAVVWPKRLLVLNEDSSSIEPPVP
jgi:hypothetical protein